MDLPPGLTQRPLTPADTHAVFELLAAQELADLGEVAVEEADVVSDWGRPGFDPAVATVGVLDGTDLVACAEVTGPGRADVAVRPDHRDRGLGTLLSGWTQATARALGHREVGQPVPLGSPGDRLLAALGYRVRWTSWALGLPAGTSVPPRALPGGYAARAARPDELEQCWTVQEDAFLEWSDRDRTSFDDWRAEITGRPGFEPWNLRVVADDSGAVVAMAWVQQGAEAAFVARLATRRDHRGRGLAQALLVDCFAEAARHGAVRSELSTDSRTGALGLYEKVGMVVTSTWVNRGIAL